jgi:hypothetical protein
MRKVSATSPNMAKAAGSRAAVAFTPKILQDAATVQRPSGGVCASGRPSFVERIHCCDCTISRAAAATWLSSPS